MLVLMTKIVTLAIFCLTQTSQANRVQISEGMPSASTANTQQSLNSLAMAILALNPAAAFNPGRLTLNVPTSGVRPKTALMLEPSETEARTSRRAAVEQAASIALLSLLSPQGASADVVDTMMAGKQGAGVGAMSADGAESILSSGVEITLTDISYKQLEACPKNFFIPLKGGPWDCIEVKATAFNQGRRKEATAAEVFGQLFDSAGDCPAAVSLDPSQKAPLATLREKFPRNTKKPVTWVMAVQRRAPKPYKFVGLKAMYANAQLAKTFKTFDDCAEIDNCDEDE
mmetsp:Transcript_42510/g.74605  ORF Transcript_42510/g.74605 Transcript_42510/m.74605 type:complete len:286 (+) Transcript_42510:51-908(+)